MNDRIIYKGSGNYIPETAYNTSDRKAGGSFHMDASGMLLDPIAVSSLSPDIAKATLKAAKDRPGYWIKNDEEKIYDLSGMTFDTGKMRSSFINEGDSDHTVTFTKGAADFGLHPGAIDKTSLYEKERYHDTTFRSSEDIHRASVKNALNASKPDEKHPQTESIPDKRRWAERNERSKKSTLDHHKEAPDAMRPVSYSSSAKFISECAARMSDSLCRNVLSHTVFDNDIYNGYKTARIYVSGAILPLQAVIASASLSSYRRNVKDVKRALKASGLVGSSRRKIDLSEIAKAENTDIDKSVKKLRELLKTPGLTENQKLIIDSAIRIKTYKERLYSFRHVKRSLRRVAARYVRYSCSDDETYRIITSHQFAISAKMSRAAIKAALKAERKARRTLGAKTDKLARKAAGDIYKRSDAVKETVDAISAARKMSAEKAASKHIRYAESLRKRKEKNKAAIRSGIRKAGSRILGEEAAAAAIRSGRRFANAAGRVKRAAGKVKGAVTKAAHSVKHAFTVIYKSLGKYIVIPAAILCIIFALTSIFGGSIISFMSVMESGFLKKEGGETDNFDASMLNAIASATAELNRTFETKIQNTTDLTSDITKGVTEGELYDAISGDISVVIAAGINLNSDIRRWLNSNYGTSLDVTEHVDRSDIITYVDDYRISCVDAEGNELPYVDLNNDATLFSMASAFIEQDMSSETPLSLRNRAAYIDYAIFLWYETHRYGVETTYKGPCDHDGVSWKEDHSFTCRNGHWGTCQECGLYKNGTNDGVDEGAYHTYSYTVWDALNETSSTHTYTVPCDGSDVYWECPGHIDITSKVTVGSLEVPTDDDDRMDRSQMEKDAWVFSMDYLGCNEVLGTADYIASLNMNMILTARSYALNKIASAFGWETMEEASTNVLSHYASNLDPKTVWKGWFDPETKEEKWERVRMFFLTGEETDPEGKKGWETLYGYKGTPYLIYSGANGGTSSVSGGGNANRAEVKAALSGYTLSDFQQRLMSYAMMAADKPVYYYWGGSPTTKDIGTVSYFGNTVSPDSKGRKRRGLDCSGFICWCYRSAGNSSFNRLTTSDMVSGFDTCDAENLEPGDIIVYNNASGGHTKLFCGYRDGYYYFIESVGEPLNRVIYSKCRSFSYMAKDLSRYR